MTAWNCTGAEPIAIDVGRPIRLAVSGPGGGAGRFAPFVAAGTFCGVESDEGVEDVGGVAAELTLVADGVTLAADEPEVGGAVAVTVPAGLATAWLLARSTAAWAVGAVDGEPHAATAGAQHPRVAARSPARARRAGTRYRAFFTGRPHFL